MTRQFYVDKQFVWEEGKALELKKELKNMENEFIDVFPTDIDYSAEDVDQMVKQFTHVIYKVSEPLFGKTFHISNDIKPNNCQPAWWQRGVRNFVRIIFIVLMSTEV